MQKELHNFVLISLTILVLLLSIFNLQNIRPNKTIEVLGATDDGLFWQEFITKHPTYRDGWLELDRMDMVKKIDPNWSESR